MILKIIFHQNHLFCRRLLPSPRQFCNASAQGFAFSQKLLVNFSRLFLGFKR